MMPNSHSTSTAATARIVHLGIKQLACPQRYSSVPQHMFSHVKTYHSHCLYLQDQIDANRHTGGESDRQIETERHTDSEKDLEGLVRPSAG